MDQSCRQTFKWNYISLLTGKIVLSNKKRNLRKYSVVFLKRTLYYIYAAKLPKSKIFKPQIYTNNIIKIQFAITTKYMFTNKLKQNSQAYPIIWRYDCVKLRHIPWSRSFNICYVFIYWVSRNIILFIAAFYF